MSPTSTSDGYRFLQTGGEHISQDAWASSCVIKNQDKGAFVKPFYQVSHLSFNSIGV